MPNQSQSQSENPSCVSILCTQPASVLGRAPTGTRVTLCPASVSVTPGWPARGVIAVLDGGSSSPNAQVNPPRLTRLQPRPTSIFLVNRVHVVSLVKSGACGQVDLNWESMAFTHPGVRGLIPTAKSVCTQCYDT